MGKLIRLIVFFILLSSKLISQEYRIFYDYSYKKDSTKIDSIENRLMVLDIDKKGSIFYDYYKYKKAYKKRISYEYSLIYRKH